MKKINSLFVLTILVVIAQYSVFASVLRPKLKNVDTSAKEIENSHTNRQRFHHRHSHEVKGILNLVQSDGFTVLLLRNRGKRNSDVKLTALQIENLRKILGNAVLEQISKSSSAEQAYNKCYLYHIIASKNPTKASRLCKEFKPLKQTVSSK